MILNKNNRFDKLAFSLLAYTFMFFLNVLIYASLAYWARPTDTVWSEDWAACIHVRALKPDLFRRISNQFDRILWHDWWVYLYVANRIRESGFDFAKSIAALISATVRLFREVSRLHTERNHPRRSWA